MFSLEAVNPANLTATEIVEAFRAGNHAGEGFDPSGLIDGWNYQWTTDGIELYLDGASLVLVGDVNGQWAVRFPR